MNQQEHIQKQRRIMEAIRTKNRKNIFQNCRVQHSSKFTSSAAKFKNLIHMLSSEDIIQQEYSIKTLIEEYQSLTQESQLTINQLFPSLMKTMKESSYENIVAESISLATLITERYKGCSLILMDNCLEELVRFIRHGHLPILQSTLYLLGNICVDQAHIRDKILKSGALQNILYVLKIINNKNILGIGLWAVSNFCRGFPLPNYQLISEAIPFLLACIKQTQLQTDILIDCLWAISYHLRQSHLEQIYHDGIDKIILEFMLSENRAIMNVAVELFMKFTSLTSYYIDEHSLSIIQQLLRDEKSLIRSKACRILINLSSKNAALMMNRQQLITKMLTMMKEDLQQVKYSILLLFHQFNRHQDMKELAKFHFNNQTVRCLLSLMRSMEVRVVKESLECLYGVLKVGQEYKINNINAFIMQMMNLGGNSILESLQHHGSKEVYEMVILIIQQFLNVQ